MRQIFHGHELAKVICEANISRHELAKVICLANILNKTRQNIMYRIYQNYRDSTQMFASKRNFLLRKLETS